MKLAKEVFAQFWEKVVRSYHFWRIRRVSIILRRNTQIYGNKFDTIVDELFASLFASSIVQLCSCFFMKTRQFKTVSLQPELLVMFFLEINSNPPASSRSGGEDFVFLFVDGEQNHA